MNQSRKRSSQIKLVLLGGIAAGALTGCGDRSAKNLPPAETVYPNDHYLQGVGYYHAPFQNWYPERYNSVRQMQPGSPPIYYYGGQWGPRPHESIVNLSAPNADGRRAWDRVHTPPVSRGGFGSSYHHYGGRSFFS
ncbi:MAG: hypothetical protein QM790_14635 [Nibricoccus sp.]